MRKYFSKTAQASFTIEAAMIVPMLLAIFALIFTMLLYYHDKNVVGVIAHESVVMGCEKEEIDHAELEQYFRKRVQGKLLLFSHVDVETQVGEDGIRMVCRARKNKMSLKTEMYMSRTEPVKFIRNQHWLNRLGKEIGEIK